jgi:hypothetical protein
VVLQLFTLMDDCVMSCLSLIVMATTNQPNSIDPALQQLDSSIMKSLSVSGTILVVLRFFVSTQGT